MVERSAKGAAGHTPNSCYEKRNENERGNHEERKSRLLFANEAEMNRPNFSDWKFQLLYVQPQEKGKKAGERWQT